MWAAYWMTMFGLRVLVMDTGKDVFGGSTEKSARLWSGLFASTPEIARLTVASLPTFEALMAKRIARWIDVLYLVTSTDPVGESLKLDAQANMSPYKGWQQLSATVAASMVPQLNRASRQGGLIEKGLRISLNDLSVYLDSVVVSAGGSVRFETEVYAVQKTYAGWFLDTTIGPIECKAVVNATGAMGDRTAELFGVKPLGLTPLKRHRGIFAVDRPWLLPRKGLFAFLPDYYFAVEDDGRLMASGSDEVSVHATDTTRHPSEIARIYELTEKYLGLRPNFDVKPQWTAGHRTFVKGRNPMLGPETDVADYYNLLAPGGYGVQAGPAMALIVACAVCGRPLPAQLAAMDIDVAKFSRRLLEASLERELQ